MNCITLNSHGGIIRHGFSDFSADGTYDAGTETYTAGCGSLVNAKKQYNKIVGGIATEMTAPEKTAVDDYENGITVATGCPTYASRQSLESIGADVDITWRPYVSQITAYNAAISLADGTKDCQLKKIYNDGTGSFILVNCSLNGNTQVRINNNTNCTLVWAASAGVWRLFDGIVGITLQ